MSILTRCVLCQSPLNERIDAMLNDHRPINYIMEWMRSAGVAERDIPHRNTFSKHKREHLNEIGAKERKNAQAVLADRVKRIRPSDGDLAVLVRDQVVEGILSGEMRPSVAEGLRGQELIDKRAARGSDAGLMAQIFVLLSGGPRPAEIMEGEFSEEREEDESEMRLLMAGE